MFVYDAFISYSSKDRKIVEPIAQRLKSDGLRVWFDQWEIKIGDSIPLKIEEGLENARVLVLCMSHNAMTSDWPQFEVAAVRFRDPLNRERRFVPLRLDETPLRGALAQFLYVQRQSNSWDDWYPQLLQACKAPPPRRLPNEGSADQPQFYRRSSGDISAYCFSPDYTLGASGSGQSLSIWNVSLDGFIHHLTSLPSTVWSLAWSKDNRRIACGSQDSRIRIFDVQTKHCIAELVGHADWILGVALNSDGSRALSGAGDKTLRLWDIATGKCLRIFEGHKQGVRAVSFAANDHLAISGSDDHTIRAWNLETGDCTLQLDGHTDRIRCVAPHHDGRRLLSGGSDTTVRVWDIVSSRCLKILEGHTRDVFSLAWGPDGHLALSGAWDTTARVWNTVSGDCVRVLEGHQKDIWAVAWDAEKGQALSVDYGGQLRRWNAPTSLEEVAALLHDETVTEEKQIRYTNAKVLLVGDSGAGKTGLSRRLAQHEWAPTDSTVGAWATQWKLPTQQTEGVEREIWLWDFGGQADQRLIHQLYMDQTAVVVLVFDGQKDDVFETIDQWVHDLTRASTQAFSKILVAGRVDAGAPRVSRDELERFRATQGFESYIETSAKTGFNCTRLQEAIVASIRWDTIAWRSTPILFKRLKDAIVQMKDEGRVLLRFNELRERLHLQFARDGMRFRDDELQAVIRLLAGPGIVWELEFGGWVLLRPELINSYAQAVIQTMRDDTDERGCMQEERVLSGDLLYQSSAQRADKQDERFVLLAMHQTLLERGLCLREQTDRGPLLVFPSYYRRERPNRPIDDQQIVIESYRFGGFIDEIYATLVVRLHHTRPFEKDQLWRYAADFRTLTGKHLGLRLIKAPNGGELEVSCDRRVTVEERMIFGKYVHEHLLQSAVEVARLRHYVCPHCNTNVENRDVAMKRLAEGRSDILCVNCEGRVPLLDEFERVLRTSFAGSKVRELEQQSDYELDKVKRHRSLYGDVISTIALAGHFCRERNGAEDGLDIEVKLADHSDNQSRGKLYIHLRAGTHALGRRVNGVQMLNIGNEKFAKVWAECSSPVIVLSGDAGGEMRWSEVGRYLQAEQAALRWPVVEVPFVGERFDAMAVSRWRDLV